jgi:hypothetical protein
MSSDTRSIYFLHAYISLLYYIHLYIYIYCIYYSSGQWFTIGDFIFDEVAEGDLGGRFCGGTWATDIRGHLTQEMPEKAGRCRFVQLKL